MTTEQEVVARCEQSVQTEDVLVVKRVKAQEANEGCEELCHLVFLPRELQLDKLQPFFRKRMSVVSVLLDNIERFTSLPCALTMHNSVGSTEVLRLLEKFSVECQPLWKIQRRTAGESEGLADEDKCARYVFKSPAWFIACLLGTLVFFQC